MSRTMVFMLGAFAALSLAPAAHADGLALPKLLAPSVRTLAPADGARCATTTFRSSVTGMLDARLQRQRRLGPRPARHARQPHRRLARLRRPRGRAGLDARRAHDRRRGLPPRGRRRDRPPHAADDPGRAAGAADRRLQLVRVSAGEQQLAALERAGLDVTHERGRGWADVIVAGAAQQAILRLSGLRFETRDADLAKSFASARAADARLTKRVGAAGSALPSGRTTYRTYDEVQAELKQLVAQHPGLVRKVSFGTSFQGREMSGVEISRNVGADDGRPVHFLMGEHHAREWPSVEAAMEFAQLLVQEQATARVASLLDRVRVVILPLVNPDGFVSSRGAFDLGDQLGQEPNVTLVEAIAPPGGLFAYRRKNCNGEILGPQLPCELAWGVDINRNYGNLWGGPGSSSDVTSQSYHGPGPRSESETNAVWDFVRDAPGDVARVDPQRRGARAAPAGRGRLGPRPRRGAPEGDRRRDGQRRRLHVAVRLRALRHGRDDRGRQLRGDRRLRLHGRDGPAGRQLPHALRDRRHRRLDGRERLRGQPRRAARGAADRRRGGGRPADHAILRGTAPAGRTLLLAKSFQTRTSPYCQKGIEPVLNIGLPVICLTGQKPPIVLQDNLRSTTVVPAAGTYEWHVNPSTRPFVGAAGGTEAYELRCMSATRRDARDAHGDDRPRPGRHAEPRLRRWPATTLGDGRKLAPSTNGGGAIGPPPSVDGVRAALSAVAGRKLAKPKVGSRTRGRKFAACTRSATRLGSVAKARAAQRACQRRFGV